MTEGREGGGGPLLAPAGDCGAAVGPTRGGHDGGDQDNVRFSSIDAHPR